MDHSAIEDRPTRNQSSTGRGWKGATGDIERVGSPVECRFEVHQLAIEAADRAVDCVTQPRGTLDDGIEHRADVGGRTGDHTKDVACGRLLIQSLREIAVTSL